MLGIPVLVDRSSYEPHPLGRTEWIKLYAALVGKVCRGRGSFLSSRPPSSRELEGFENTGKTVAFFFVNSDGSVVIRKPTDYIPKMIELAGGRYAFEDFVTDPDEHLPFPLPWRTFYGTARGRRLCWSTTPPSTRPSRAWMSCSPKTPCLPTSRPCRRATSGARANRLYQATDIVGEHDPRTSISHLTGGDGRAT